MHTQRQIALLQTAVHWVINYLNSRQTRRAINQSAESDVRERVGERATEAISIYEIKNSRAQWRTQRERAQEWQATPSDARPHSRARQINLKRAHVSIAIYFISRDEREPFTLHQLHSPRAI